VVLIAVSSSYALAHRVSKPLSDLAATVHELSAANLGRRLDVPQSSDELGQLAASFNGMLDRLETSFRDLESATAYVSHELRTSLAVVRTQLEVGLSGARELETAARQALAATDRAVEMVDQALALATRSIPEAAAPLDLALIVAQVVDDYSRPGRVIEFDLPPEGVPPVRGHATWLYRAVANLVGNAFKYGPPEGPVLIRVSRRYDAVLVEVQDRGTGIPAGELDLIWERFRRGSAASRSTGSPQEPGEAGRGYGLGLALVKQAVEAAGGMTWATSAEGCGSVFHLSFPVANRA
jgi:signal transduction histidine kinase